MELENLLKLLKENKKYTIEQLERIFSISQQNRMEFYQRLFELEKMGKLFVDEFDLYCKVPTDFYYYHGILKLSNQKRYYITLKDKTRILIDEKDLKNAKIGDSVFVEKSRCKTEKHKKHIKGKVVRVATIPKQKTQDCYFVKEVIRKNKKNNSFYIEHDGFFIKIPKYCVQGAYPGDLVSLKVYVKNNDIYAEVEEVLERRQESHVFLLKNGKWHPIGTEYYETKIINLKKDLQENTKVLAKIGEKNAKGAYNLEILQVIEEKTPNNTIELLAMEKGFPISFQEKILEETKNILPNIKMSEERKDLRELLTFTIDPITAKDLDDAVSLEKMDSFYRLYVHIADVDYYVKYNTELWKEAIRRGTSVYLGDLVLPQFPKKISEQLCSLNPHEEKMVKTIVMDIDTEGKVINFDLFHSVIKSAMKMNYDAVNRVLEGIEKVEYNPFKKTLEQMQELSEILSARRQSRGSLLLESQEVTYEFNAYGEPITIKRNSRGPSQIMIENFMLIANETVAKYAYWLNIPFVYRNHPVPTKIEEIKLKRILKENKNIIKRIQNISNPAYIQKYIRNLCNSKEELNCITELFFKVLPRAYYKETNEGHYALALDCYGTVSSPIRKGSDLINHFVLGSVLNGKIDGKEIEQLREELPRLCTHFTERQIFAEELESEVNEFLIKKYYNTYTVQDIIAKIVCFMEEKVYVKLHDGMLGVLPLNRSYKIDLAKNRAIDSYGNIYRVGDEIILNISIKKVKNNMIQLESISQENSLKRIKERRNF